MVWFFLNQQVSKYILTKPWTHYGLYAAENEKTEITRYLQTVWVIDYVVFHTMDPPFVPFSI